MPIWTATVSDIPNWVALRARLWPDTSLDQHRTEAEAMLVRTPHEGAVFLEAESGGDARAFAEVTLRHDHVNGCESSPVAFFEGIYVDPSHHGSGIGRCLLEAVQAWAREQGCTELGSDADIGNAASHAFHRALGFEETERVVFFRKSL